MAAKNYLKISYKGLTRTIIICDTNLRYEDILKTVMEKFNISESYKNAIEFYDEQSNKYNKATFEYLLLLFPNPQKMFFIRFDSTKIINPANTDRRIKEDGRTVFGFSKFNNITKSMNEANQYCEAVPVRRQNCFLGQFPDNTRTAHHNQPAIVAHEIVKRAKFLKQSSPKTKNIATQSVLKRSMRI